MENETSAPPYRGSTRKFARVLAENHLTAAGTLRLIFASIFAATVIVWMAALIKSNLLAASRPERILVRIPTPVPGPVRMVEHACPVPPECQESVRTVDMQLYQASPGFVCNNGAVIHDTIHDHYLIVECFCQSQHR